MKVKTSKDVKSFDKGDYVQVQSGPNASKEGEVLERRHRKSHYGDELVIEVDVPYWSTADGSGKEICVVDPLKCVSCPRHIKK